MSKISFEKKSFRFILKASYAACLFALSIPTWAAGCKQRVDFDRDVLEARKAIAHALLASFRPQVNGYALLETEIRYEKSKDYCADELRKGAGFSERISAVYHITEEGKKSLEQTSVCWKEYQSIEDTPYPPDVQAQLTQAEEELMDMPAKRRVMRRGTPEEIETYKREEQLRKLRWSVTEPHRKELETKYYAAVKRCNPLEKIALAKSKIQVIINTNSKYPVDYRYQYLGKPAENNYLEKRVTSIEVVGFSDYPTGDHYANAVKQYAFPHIPQLLDMSKVQAVFAGNVPNASASQAEIDALSAAVVEGKKLRSAYDQELSQTRQRKTKTDALQTLPRRAATAATPAPSPASNAAAPQAAQASAAPSPVSAPAPAAPAPAAANPINVPNLPNLGNAAEGLNKLKGLFGR